MAAVTIIYYRVLYCKTSHLFPSYSGELLRWEEARVTLGIETLAAGIEAQERYCTAVEASQRVNGPEEIHHICRLQIADEGKTRGFD